MGLVKEAAKLVVYSEPFRRAVRRSAPLSSALIRAIRVVDPERLNTGGTDDARYCYGAWLRHWKAGGLRSCPSTVLEVGPGDSLGVGLTAMLCGADTLYGVDGHRYADPEGTLRLFEQIVRLVEQRAPIPSSTEFPEMRPHVVDYAFPEAVRPRLDADRIESIRACIRSGMTGERHGGCAIKYAAPWQRSDVPAGSVDMIYSQATMEHVADVPDAYASMFSWLRPGGRIQHQIDFRCHSTSLDWNGHWMYSAAEWQILQDDKTYYWINRLPCSEHLLQIGRRGFAIESITKSRNTSGLRAEQFAEEFRAMTPDDAECEGVYVIATKPSHPQG